MKLAPWKDRAWNDLATKPLLDMRKEMNRLFDTFSMPSLWKQHAQMFSPSIEVSEDEKSYTVRAEVPGLDKKDIKVSLQNNVLTIGGEKRQEKEERKKNTYYRETRYGAFHRSIPFEAEVDSKNIRTKFENGVLVLTLEKKEGTKAAPAIDIEVR